MNEILGILLPLLFSGADIQQIIAALGKTGGSAQYDGLEGMMRKHAFDAMDKIGKHPDSETIRSAIESVLDSMSMNPYTELGQGASAILEGIYHMAPAAFGNMIGVPYSGQFFSTISNGSYGISSASGAGPVDIFNPYSAMESYENTMMMARQMYDMGVRKRGGYDVSFGHGLNMSEMGLVSQRILSSEIPYMYDGRMLNLEKGEDGKYVDEEDGRRFSDNLKRLGSKFNESASVLAKITGSIEEALRLMDRISGGNFLGESEEKALSVAQRAKEMAASMRITSAISGIPVKDLYENMTAVGLEMARATGMSDTVARDSGYISVMTDLAYNSTASYGAWAATHPNATEIEKNRALFASNGIAQLYAKNNGAALAAAVADNIDRFTDEQINEIAKSYSNGHPNDMLPFIREKIGGARLEEYLTNPTMQIAARYRISQSEEKQEIGRMLDAAGMEGARKQAENEGFKNVFNMSIRDMHMRLDKMTGGGDESRTFLKESEGAAAEELRKIAVEEYGLDEEFVSDMNEHSLRNFLVSRHGMDGEKLDRIAYTAKIEGAKRKIDSITMDEDELKEARDRLVAEIKSSNAWGEKDQNELIERLESGEDMVRVMEDFVKPIESKNAAEARAIRNRVTGGRLTKAQADEEKARLDEFRASTNVNFTPDEIMRAVEEDVAMSDIGSQGRLVGVLARNGVGSSADKAALSSFAEPASRLAAEGNLKLPGGGTFLTETYNEAASKMIGDMLSGLDIVKPGELNEELSQALSEKMLAGVASGRTIQDSFYSAVEGLDGDLKEKMGESYAKLVEEAKGALNPGSDTAKTFLNRRVMLSIAKDKIRESSAGVEGADEYLGELERSADELGSQGFGDDQSEIRAVKQKVLDLVSNGDIQMAISEEDIEGIDTEASRLMVSKIFGSRVGKMEGKKLTELESRMAKRMTTLVSDEGSSLHDAFSTALSEELGNEEVVNAMGGKDSDGVKQAREWVESAKDASSQLSRDSLSIDNWSGSMLGILNRRNSVIRSNAVKGMRNMLLGKSPEGGEYDVDDSTAAADFMDLAQRIRLFEGDEDEFAEKEDDAFREYLEENLGTDIPEEEMDKIVSSAIESYRSEDGGDYREAALSAIDSRIAELEGADDEESKRMLQSLSSSAQAISEDGNARTRVLGKVLRGIGPDGIRDTGFYAVSQAGDANVAGVSIAASASGFNFRRPPLDPMAADAVSHQDDAVAAAGMNRMPNFLHAGESGFAKAAIEDVTKQMSELGAALKSEGFESAEDVKKALADPEGEGKEAMEKIYRAVGGKDTKQGKERLNLLRTLGDGFKIGESDALSAAMDGNLENMRKKPGANDDLLAIVRDSKRRDSDAYKVMDSIGKLIQGFSKFIDNPLEKLGDKSIPVNVTGGKINVLNPPGVIK